MAYLRWLSEERRARFGSLTMETTEMSLKAVLAAVAMGDADTAIKFLTLAMRDEIARERLWFGQQG
jgi:hypothetical protein